MRLFVLALFYAVSSYASECSNLYPNNDPIVVPETVELCNTFFVTAFDKTNNRVILVSEHLTSDSVGKIKRSNDFHYDSRIGKVPNPEQYKHTGFDKGHMAPAADASTEKEMHETFLMTNMTPQRPSVNRVSWKMLEERTRTYFLSSKKDMYVVNIAVYSDDKKMNNIPIPSGYWKIVYSGNKTFYYYADNADGAEVMIKDPIDIKSLINK